MKKAVWILLVAVGLMLAGIPVREVNIGLNMPIQAHNVSLSIVTVNLNR